MEQIEAKFKESRFMTKLMVSTLVVFSCLTAGFTIIAHYSSFILNLPAGEREIVAGGMISITLFATFLINYAVMKKMFH